MAFWRPRLIALDIDGTMLDPASALTNATLRAIQMAREKGAHIVLCSGRYFPGVRAIAWQARLDGILIVGNGAQIRTADGAILFHRGLDPVPCRAIAGFAEKWGLCCNLYAADRIYFNRDNRVIDAYVKLNREVPPEYCCAYCSMPDLRMAIKEYAGAILKMEVLSLPGEALPELLSLSRSYPQIAYEGNLQSSVEIHAAGVDKGTGLRWAAEYYGIPLESTMAFGDGDNDIPMLRMAHIGVAMQNGTLAVQNAADAIAPDNANDGVARMIYQYYM